MASKEQNTRQGVEQYPQSHKPMLVVSLEVLKRIGERHSFDNYTQVPLILAPVVTSWSEKLEQLVQMNLTIQDMIDKHEGSVERPHKNILHGLGQKWRADAFYNVASCINFAMELMLPTSYQT
jgi:hypothetical protein